MDIDWGNVTHVTKIDPAKALPSDLSVLEATDLVLVGGSDGVTESNTLETIRAIEDATAETPLLQEPNSSSHVSRATIEAVDAVAVPAVYNGDHEHFVGKHVDLFAEIAKQPDELLGSSLPVVGDVLTEKGEDVVAELTRKIVGEGYVVQHADSAAASVSGAAEPYTPTQVAGAALATETFYDFPIFYVEYSGTYGGTEDVAAADRYLEETTLLYGGGIDSQTKAREILAAGADAVVVGDCFHADRERFRETIPR